MTTEVSAPNDWDVTELPLVVRQALTEARREGGLRFEPAEVADAIRPLVGNGSGRIALVGAPEAACWSSALSCLLEPGDRILAAGGGDGTLQWADHLRTSGFEVIRGSAGWGEPPSPEEISYLLWWDPSIKAVFVNHCDVMSGAPADLRRIRQAMDDSGSTALLLVDVSGTLGIADVRQDDWRVDVAVSGSDRGLMNPSGATIVSLSSRATAAADSRTAYPPVSDPLLSGLRAAIEAIFDEGLGNVLHRHARMAAAVRAAVGAWGLRTAGSPSGRQSAASTTILLPPGISGQELSAACRREFGVRLAPYRGGHGDGAVVWQHHGDYAEARCLADIAAVELVLARLGHAVRLGTGLAVAAPRLQERIPHAAP